MVNMIYLIIKKALRGKENQFVYSCRTDNIS
jgi:hypothetical protein